MLDDILEIEDIIPVDHQKHIHDTMTSFNFPWAFNKNVVSDDKCFVNQKNNPPGFNHFFYENNTSTSSFFELVYPILLNLSSRNLVPFNRIIRMRGNLTLSNQSIGIDKFMPHIDSFFPHIVAIYYVNDSDGDTILFDQTNDDYDSGEKDINTIKHGEFTIKRRVTPKQGKLLVFPGNRYHTASFCKDSNYRCVINMNLGKILL